MVYLFQVTCCWGMFYVLYVLLLSRETFFQANRWYLLVTLCLGGIVPLIRWQPNEELLENVTYLAFEPILIGAQELEIVANKNMVVSNSSWDYWNILWVIYWIGVLVTAARLFLGLSQIFRLYQRSELVREGDIAMVYTPKYHLPFSFFHWLFWSSHFEATSEEKEQILRHEAAHIRQWHTLDILFLEVLTIFFWCCPPIYLYRTSLRIVHEYLADAWVLKTTHRKQYGRLLLKQHSLGLQIALANHFIQSQLKKRILMMTQNKSSKKALAKYLPMLPLMALAFMLFSNREINAGITNATQGWNDWKLSDTIPLQEGDKIYRVADEMPRFADCPELTTVDEKKYCAEQKMVEYLYSNIKYPNSAKDAKAEGTVVVKFIVEKDGTISDETIVRSIHPDCDAETLNIIAKMRDDSIIWIPGMQDGKPVRVQYMLPVKFKLEEDAKALVLANPPTPPKTPQVGEDEVFKVVEEMPRFKGCEDIDQTKESLNDCATRKMIEFLYQNMKYPKTAKDAGVEGTAVVQFTVEKDGSLSDVVMVRKVGAGCDEEVERIIALMNTEKRWIPGRQRGRLVRVRCTLPVKFKLEATTSQPLAETEQGIPNLSALKVMPNPSNGVLTLRFQSDAVPTVIRVTDLQGKVIYQENLSSFNGNYDNSIDLSKHPKGMYVLLIEQGNKRHAERLVFE